MLLEINCCSGMLGFVPQPNLRATSDLLIAAATGFAGGFAGPVVGKLVGSSLNAAAKIGAGAFGAGVGNAASQKINTGSVDLVPVAIAATGGAFGAAATLPLGISTLEAFSAGSISAQFGFAAGAASAIVDRTQNRSRSGK